MADTHLLVDRARQDAMDLTQANTEMKAALDDMIHQLAPIKQSFEGATSTAWQEVQTAVDNASKEMHNAHQQGTVALENMIQAIIDADNKGSNIF
ncbi:MULTISPECIES: WXG100 family type VII secretion target [Streptomyces]|uniref:Uncharacterized protein n=1 Tax=Streptomyces benahoarensis TaxID=2595054 RepID=A0A553ZQV2_9ACTN|nr:hypothetical protein [Streptomyces benahoarensis]TSB20592.1 hypothetical protein FNJ62_20685 [Streptomyces benahoarensis]TSB43840.1 hypothetical protein FNZ23_02205 [Streptomyces benahoarensis]